MSKMQYAIITNPASGRMTVDRKRSFLTQAAEILDAEIHGLDTVSAKDFAQRAQALANQCDVLVVAGGDGTLSDVINSIDTASTPIAYLPSGTGNAMRYALEYRGGLADIAMRIRDGKIREYDLVSCDERRRAFMASVGIEGSVLRLREQYVSQGGIGFKTYFKAVLNAYFKEYQRASASITVDGKTCDVKNLLSLMVVKQPFYGFGMKVVPKARFRDGRLHILSINSGLFKSAVGGITAFTIGNQIGRYRTGQRLSVSLDRPLILQIDGNDGWEADRFQFSVIPNGLKIKC
ncbi:diacylglycerol/lipid kinase family protein [Thermodesulfobacteriota bacterium]